MQARCGRSRAAAVGLISLSAGFAAAQPITSINSPTPGVNGAFGYAVAPIGDVTGDARPDIVIGALAEGTNFAGQVHIAWGTIGIVQPGYTIAAPLPKFGAKFGASVAGAPDVNGDAVPDVVIGAPGIWFGTQPSGAGAVYLYSGANRAFLRVLQSPNLESNGNFGHSVAAMTDVNADGRGDVIVGAPFENPAPAPFNSGRAYVFSGKNGVLLHSLVSPAPLQAGKFGTSVASVPDLSGDGKPDVLVGAQEFGGEGRVHVYSGATGVFIRTLESPNKEVGGIFGWSVSGVPDANGDNLGDIVVGAPGEDPGTSPVNSGRAYVFSGATGQLLRTLISGTPEAGGQFGRSVAGMPDTNNDSRGDVVVGAPFEDPGISPASAGRAYLHSGATGVRLQTLTSVSEAANGQYGISVCGIGDVNLNTRAEVVVGALRELLGGVNAGRSFLHRR